VNVLKAHRQAAVITLLAAGKTQREIERITGSNRKTVRAYQQQLDAEQAIGYFGPTRSPPGWSPALPFKFPHAEHRHQIRYQRQLASLTVPSSRSKCGSSVTSRTSTHVPSIAAVA
jgi:hypothetical protein